MNLLSFFQSLPVCRNKFAVAVCLSAVAVRLAALLFYDGVSQDYYWEYGEIAKNVKNGKGYALWYYEGEHLEHRYSAATRPHTSAYMPPGYPAVLLPFLAIDNISLRNFIFYGLQALLIVPAIMCLWRLSLRLFGRQAAQIAVLSLAFLPEFIYSSLSAGPTALYHLFTLMLLSMLVRRNEISVKTIIFWGILCGTTIYLRSEFALYSISLFFIFALRLGIKCACTFGAVVILLIAPWQIRNYINFGRVIPMTTSSGLNLYRGHNPEFIGSWGDSVMIREIAKYKNAPDFEVKMNDIYLCEAAKFILKHPLQEARYTLEKITHLWLLNPSDKRTLHPAYIVPWIVTLCCFAVGFFIKPNKFYDAIPLYIFWGASTVVCIIFFALPRYQILLKPAILPFAAAGALKIYYFFSKK